ncbi:type I restriction enzyme M protein [Okibacterium sp. HSC-33S16]|uniref:hypothetical protein n=1 Tax=Okibacterium sp. HSC-33S16 TaxID=2910965 RepID=UPI0020A18553|nr:hypothetical protein [Okibacterium sp. HSC-33S16]MCP2031151.1 type I restriction enzyme M protein [Okibacterium sp. HSC-33S16]
MIHKPSWFRDGEVMVSTAPTCGLAKGGRLLPLVDRKTGKKVQVEDPETRELVDAVDDQLKADMEALRDGNETPTLRFVPMDGLSLRTAVPTYFDRRFDSAFDEAMRTEKFAGFTSMSIGEMVEAKLLTFRNGHGSPTQSVRVGKVPYIKVSDLRAGLVNINPTNRVPTAVAEQFWKGTSSGLKAWDLICPERTSKNIGDFCMLMPGQEQVVTTKEVIVLRPGDRATFDPFYLMWAMSLTIVRDQWRRVVFMQTNREDVGDRFLEIRIPVPTDRRHADSASEPFRGYYRGLAAAREQLSSYLTSEDDHHFFLGTAAEPVADVLAIEEDAALADPN